MQWQSDAELLVLGLSQDHSKLDMISNMDKAKRIREATAQNMKLSVSC